MGGIVNVVIVAWTNDVSVVVVPQSEEDPPSEVSSCCRRRGRSSPTTSLRGSTRMVLPVALITSSRLSPTTMPSIAEAPRGRDGEVFEETSRASPSCFIIIGSEEAEARWGMPPLWEEKMVSFYGV